MIGIDVLHDDVLVEIFDFYVDHNPHYEGRRRIEAWQSLVHVCRRWRFLVFGLPRRLNLRLFCTHKTHTRGTLDVWPALPLIVDGDIVLPGTDNIVAALEQSNRVFKVSLEGRRCDWAEVLAAMQVPFPELTDLDFSSDDERSAPVIPDSFLGGSAPRLRLFGLTGIPFPGLPKLLMSATHLVKLDLANIPLSGYISPQAMVALISVLSSLKSLSLYFEPKSGPDWESQSLHSPERSILPAVDEFYFKGNTEYLEELVTRIDIPQLKNLNILFFGPIDFDTPRLAQFINRIPTFRALDEACMRFGGDWGASVALEAQSSTLEIEFFLGEPDREFSSVAHVCNSSLHPLSTVEDLYIEHQHPERVSQRDAIEITEWLQLLVPFTAVENLYLSKEFAPQIAVALQELAGITEVLPNLQNIFVEGLKPSGPIQENIGQFVAARRHSDHTIAISGWDKTKIMT